MKTNFSLFLLFFFISFSAVAQIDMKAYEGNWRGKLENPDALNITVSIEVLENNKYLFSFLKNKSIITKTIQSKSKTNLHFDLWDNLKFNGVINKDHTEISGFIKSGILIYHIDLKEKRPGKYIGIWKPIIVDHLESDEIYLNIEEANGENYAAYPFFKDQRFPGTWCLNFNKKGNQLTWNDFKSGIQFHGILLENKIKVDIHFNELIISSIDFQKMDDNFRLGTSIEKENSTYSIPNQTNDGWTTLDLKSSKIDQKILEDMADSVYANAITYTHSILIAKKGVLVYEKYFSDYNQNIPHDQRSAAKSVASAIIGIAIDDQLIKNVDQSIYDFIPEAYQYTKDSLKSTISIRNLLTMSSGIDAVDFGVDRPSKASEDTYQNSPDWLKTVLEAPMINKPGIVANYGSANPYLLGVGLSTILNQPMELYMDQKLFAPLGITNYILQVDLNNQPYFGGGNYLTPRDMLKFGQLYLNKGQWKGQQIISEEWVEKSLKNYMVLENANNKNGYSFFWWHTIYEVNDQKIKSVEARGAGGQYIALIPDLNIVVAITSGNYRNGRFWQPEQIIEKYILPAVIKNQSFNKKID